MKDMGADIIIGVDVAHVKQDMEINSIYDVIMQKPRYPANGAG